MAISINTTVSFPIDNPSIGSFENMHAISLGGEIFLLDNSPFYVYNVSYKDRILAKNICGRLSFVKVMARGGHSTYRIKLSKGLTHYDFMLCWPNIAEIGCSYEGSSAEYTRLYSIDVPPAADVQKLYDILFEYEQAGIWEFEEAHFYQTP